jgi:acetyl-CoA carboxylase alpha subunit
MASILRRVLRRHLKELEQKTPEELIKDRHEKFQNIGSFIEP